MENKVIKFQSELSNKVITLTVDEKLNNIDLKNFAPEKQAKVNAALKGIKLPK